MEYVAFRRKDAMGLGVLPYCCILIDLFIWEAQSVSRVLSQ